MFLGEVELEGYPIRQYRINDLVIGISTQFGPRILQLSPIENPDLNIFGILHDKGVATREGFWNTYGGHRLWSSPEATPRSYSLENTPIQWVEKESSLTLLGPIEIQNSLQKEIILEPEGPKGIRITHRLKNIGRWPIRMACWGLSVMKPNGFAAIPILPGTVDAEGLLPDRKLVLWPYTDLSDSRLILQKDFLFLRQDPSKDSPVKIGATSKPAIAFYHWNFLTFVKKTMISAGEYPDGGASFEVYANTDMLELESLGPLSLIQPDDFIEHIESWNLLKTGPLTPNSKDFYPLINA